MDIKIIRRPDQEQLGSLGVSQWPIWEKEASRFPWHYDSTEVCYILEGEVVVTPEGGDAVSMGPGDLVTFPAGMSCHWDIRIAIRKHYRFE